MAVHTGLSKNSQKQSSSSHATRSAPNEAYANSSTPTTRPDKPQPPKPKSHTTGASACITPGSAQSTAPRGKIGDRPHGDAHSTQFRNLRFCSPSTSCTQALAPSGPNPQPVTIMSHPAGSCSRALPIIHSAWAPSLPFLSSPAPGPIPAHPSFLAYDSNTSRAPSQRG
jgi:hypothetical protein